MKSLAMSDSNPAAPQRERPAEARSVRELPYRIIALAAAAAGLLWIARQPPEVSAEILRVVLLMGTGVLGAKTVGELIADLRGRGGMERLEIGGRWIGTAFASMLVVLVLAAGLAVVWHFSGPTILRLPGFLGLPGFGG